MRGGVGPDWIGRGRPVSVAEIAVRPSLRERLGLPALDRPGSRPLVVAMWIDALGRGLFLYFYLLYLTKDVGFKLSTAGAVLSIVTALGLAVTPIAGQPGRSSGLEADAGGQPVHLRGGVRRVAVRAGFGAALAAQCRPDLDRREHLLGRIPESGLADRRSGASRSLVRLHGHVAHGRRGVGRTDRRGRDRDCRDARIQGAAGRERLHLRHRGGDHPAAGGADRAVDLDAGARRLAGGDPGPADHAAGDGARLRRAGDPDRVPGLAALRGR